MYSPFHKLLMKSQGSFINRPLVSYYFILSYYYSLLASTIGFFSTLFYSRSVYHSGKVGERVPTLNAVREVEELLKHHGFLNDGTPEEAYNAQNYLDTFSFDFKNVMKNKEEKLKTSTISSDGDTTFVTDDCPIGDDDDDFSLSDLDEFVSLMQNCKMEE
uniref:Uncharacterized protein n=1 Tax=Theileria annulata TaxID=5874 RepID=A0A3B0MP47_THEAN